VLRVIGAEPGLSNDEIALHVGIKSRGTTSTLLGRLARFGLIENTRTGGRVNVWQLTASGRELEAAIRHENPDAGQVASAESSVTLCRRPFYADMG
jgi:DNA-binding MarR family transcriptional regulator